MTILPHLASESPPLTSDLSDSMAVWDRKRSTLWWGAKYKASAPSQKVGQVRLVAASHCWDDCILAFDNQNRLVDVEIYGMDVKKIDILEPPTAQPGMIRLHPGEFAGIAKPVSFELQSDLRRCLAKVEPEQATVCFTDGGTQGDGVFTSLGQHLTVRVVDGKIDQMWIIGATRRSINGLPW